MSSTRKRQGSAEFLRWMGPLLEALRELGGSSQPREAAERIATTLKLSDSVLDATNKTGQGRFYNQVAWARKYLVWEGLLDGSRRGVWSLTPSGQAATLNADESRELFRKWVKIHAESRKAAVEGLDGKPTDSEQHAEPLLPVAPGEEDEAALLIVLRGLSSGGLERICQRLLRESGFESVEVLGRSHDGGIDGVGLLQLNAFVRIKVLFQCKRYKGSVSREEVGTFRNSLMGRAEKGIFMTTGRFTKSAQTEATRDGAIPIELVDGETLVELFERVGLGVKARTVFDVDYGFFEPFKT